MKNRKHKLFSNCNKGDFELNTQAHKCTRESKGTQVYKKGKGTQVYKRNWKSKGGRQKAYGSQWHGAAFWAQPGH